ncbi:MAG: hypothetical protein QM689_12560 [Oscillospiraceae bacterium]
MPSNRGIEAGFEQFRIRAKKAMIDKGWKNADLAKATGYAENTIMAFMSPSGSKSEFTANVIAKALEIER